MALRELVGGLTDSSSVKRVFGAADSKRTRVLVIPVANIRGPSAAAKGRRARPIPRGCRGAAAAVPGPPRRPGPT